MRPMRPSDSAALIKLISDNDGDMTTRFSLDAYTAIVDGTEFRTIGVVAEHVGSDGIVGMGTVRFGESQFNGDTLPMAFLDGLKVQKDFRGQGLGYQIAEWRIQHALQTLGDRCIILTGMQKDNLASYSVAKKWATEIIHPAFQALVLPTRNQPPRALGGLTAREIQPKDYEEFAAKHNKYYSNYNLVQMVNPASIEHALAISPEGIKPYSFFVAEDARGNLLAGAQTWSRGALKVDQVNNLPLSLRLLNQVLKLLPPDLVVRDTEVSGLWYETEQIRSARFLIESIRYKARSDANFVTIGFDLRDPTRHALTLRPWNQPRPMITIAIRAPSRIDRGRLLFASGRV